MSNQTPIEIAFPETTDLHLRLTVGACKLRGNVRVDTNPVVKVGDEIALVRCGDLIRMDVAAPVQEMTVDAAKELIAALQGLCTRHIDDTFSAVMDVMLQKS